MNDSPPPQPVFVYSGSGNPESEVSQSNDGHGSDYWKVDKGVASLRRQAGPNFETIHTVPIPSVTGDVLKEIADKFSVYHTDALQKIIGE